MYQCIDNQLFENELTNNYKTIQMSILRFLNLMLLQYYQMLIQT
jgi:hypothetical protein